MDQKTFDLQLPTALARLVSRLTNYPIESLDELDRLNNLRPLIIQIDENHFNPNLFGLKDITWEQAIKEVEVYLEGFEIYDGLSVSPDADLEKPSGYLVAHLLSQFLAVHWLCNSRIDETLETLDKTDRDCIIEYVGPFKAALAEAIARETIQAHKDKATEIPSVLTSSGVFNGSKSMDRRSSSVTAQRLQSKVNTKERQLEAEAVRIRKMEEFIDSLKTDINNACSKNDELETLINQLRIENQSVKTDIRYQKNRNHDLNVLLEKEKLDKEHAFEELATLNRTLARLHQEQAVYNQAQVELTEMLAMKSKYMQYMEERESFVNANNEVLKEKHNLVKQLGHSRELMENLQQSFKEEVQKVKEATEKQMKLEMENLLLAKENQELKVEVASLTRLFDNENMNKRKQQAEAKGAAKAGAQRNEELEQARMQLARMKAENYQLRKQAEEDKKEFQSEIEGAMEAQRRVTEALEQARSEVERLTNMPPPQPQPMFRVGQGSELLESLVEHGDHKTGVGKLTDGSDQGSQVGPELLEKREIDSNYIVYSAVMEFMTGHMENFRDSNLKRPVNGTGFKKLFASNLLG